MDDELTTIRAELEQALTLSSEATEGPWEVTPGNPTMSGETWTLRIKGKPGIRIQAHEYQHGMANANLIAAYRSLTPKLAGAMLAVLDLHRPQDRWQEEMGECGACLHANDEQALWPCETVRPILAAWGGQDDER